MSKSIFLIVAIGVVIVIIGATSVYLNPGEKETKDNKTSVTRSIEALSKESVTQPSSDTTDPIKTLDNATGWNVYTNYEYAFEVRYPLDFEMTTTNMTPNVAKGAIVQFQLINDHYYQGTNLTEASVVIGVTKGQQDVLNCLNTGSRTVQKQEINGIPFQKYKIEEGATGSAYERIVYRTVYRKACYELVAFIHSFSVGAVYPRVVSEFDREAVMQKLNEVLLTFRFLD